MWQEWVLWMLQENISASDPNPVAQKAGTGRVFTIKLWVSPLEWWANAQILSKHHKKKPFPSPKKVKYSSTASTQRTTQDYSPATLQQNLPPSGGPSPEEHSTAWHGLVQPLLFVLWEHVYQQAQFNPGIKLESSFSGCISAGLLPLAVGYWSLQRGVSRLGWHAVPQPGVMYDPVGSCR